MRALVLGTVSVLGVAMFAGFVWMVLDSSRDWEGDDDCWRE